MISISTGLLAKPWRVWGDLFLSLLLVNAWEVFTHKISFLATTKIKALMPRQDLCQVHLFSDLWQSTLSQAFIRLWFHQYTYRVLHIV